MNAELKGFSVLRRRRKRFLSFYGGTLEMNICIMMPDLFDRSSGRSAYDAVNKL